MKRMLAAFALLVTLAVVPVTFLDVVGRSMEPVCVGRTNSGSVEGARRLPIRGGNFETYCLPCVLALRTYGHAPAIETTLAAFERLARERPGTRYVYGEIGRPWGGRFRPHRTHRNGLSFDFMVPLTGTTLPTGVGNRFGYDETFDENGLGTAGQIDFPAVAALIRALDREAGVRGGGISLVVLAPDLQDDLERADPGITDALRFNRRASWVRHDDHIHVDFAFPCRG